MTSYESLRKVPLFADLPEADLARLCSECHEDELPAGFTLFEEGDVGDAAYVITAGTIEIVKSLGTKEVLLARRHTGEVIGEMALLKDEPRMASARTAERATLLVIPKPALAHLLDSSPGAVRSLFDILLERLRSTESQLRQSERMAQLGTMTAGVAHELNNPAAAIKRAADQLDSAVHHYAEARANAEAPLAPDRRETVAELTRACADATPPLDAIERSDIEQALETALSEAGVEEPWTMSSDLVEAGVRPTDVGALRDHFDGAELAAVLGSMGAGRAVESLLHTISSGSSRLSAIVTALKSYAYLDQAPVQDVDITEGIDDTIVILGPKLHGITITKEYAPDLPRIEVHGSELNQVWTNVLDNAADAIAERRAAEGENAAGTITIRASADDHALTIAIADDGPGVPQAILTRIFDAFFTTKEPGKGAGLGLDISYRIIVTGHGGDLTVDSEPGNTTFSVVLPLP